MNETPRQTYSPAEGDYTTLPRGMQLGPYRILSVLGQGGFGVTYLAQDISTGDSVVIKESLPSLFATRNSTTRHVTALHGEEDSYEWATRRFLEEATLLCKLDHPNIVRVIKAFTALGTAYYVMPWVGGASLDNAPLTDEPTKSAEAAEGLLNAMLDTLCYLHSHNLLHRDIKPANILLTRDKFPVLIDFGTARARIGDKTRTRLESPGYTPFEQIQKHGNVGDWSDIYALAATMVKILTGEDPPSAADRLAKSVRFVPLASRPELRTIYPPQFLKSIDKGFALNEKKRWQSAEEWKEYLQTGGRTNRTFLWSGLGAAAVVTLAAGLYCGGVFTETPTGALQRRAAEGDAVAACELAGLYLTGNDELAQDTEKALQLLRRAAEKGHAEACFLLGSFYAEGQHGLAASPEEAAKWYHKASDAEHEEGMLRWACCLLQGEGTKKDPSAAIPLLTKRADGGNATAQRLLAACYETGNGVTADIPKAITLFRAAAQQGDKESYGSLGCLLLNGARKEVTEEDKTEAFQWLKLSADTLGEGRICYWVGRCYSEALGTEKNDKEAFAYHTQAAEKGYAAGKTALGCCYKLGRGTEKDLTKAVTWYTQAAEQDDTEAQEALGELYFHGKVPSAPTDLSKAAYWLTKAAEKNAPLAQAYLGTLLFNGEGGLAYTPKKACELLKKSADAGCGLGLAQLGLCYERGLAGLPKDINKALELYRKGVEAGSGRAMASLGYCYQNGLGVQKDEKRALKLYEDGMKAGDENAYERMGLCYYGGTCGLPKDAEKAARHYTLAREATRICPAAVRLAFCYLQGNGVPKDSRQGIAILQELDEQGLAEAHSWLAAFRLLGEQGFTPNHNTAFRMLTEAYEKQEPIAACYLGHCYRYGWGTKVDEKKAVQYYQESAERDFAPAQLAISGCYDEGVGVPRDPEKSLYWCRLSAENGFAEAQCNLGLAYEKGEGCDKDLNLAFKYFLKAAENGLTDIMCVVARYYTYGEGDIKQDYEKGFDWYRKAAEAEDGKGMMGLAWYYHKGWVGTTNQPEAMKWFRKAAEKDIADAQYYLGVYYRDGLGGLQKDKEKAREWISKAAQAGFKLAQQDLKKL